MKRLNTVSETSPLRPHSSKSVGRTHSYGSLLPYFNFFRNTLARSSSLQKYRDMEQNEYEHVTALLRGLHGPTKNVARPGVSSSELSSAYQNVRIKNHNEQKKVTNVKLSQAHEPLIQIKHDNTLKFPIQHQINLQIPELLITTVEQQEHHHKKFLPFGLRRHSHTALSRCESMGSLGHRALIQFIECNDIAGLKTFLDTRNVHVDERDENNGTALMYASGKGVTVFARELITRGADIQTEDLDSWTSLLSAAKNGHLEVVELLVDHGANIEHRDMGGWTALMWSSYRGHTEIVSFLLEKGADIHAHGNYHLGPLLWAAGRGHTDIVRSLVQRGAKVNVGDKYGTTALVWACRKGNADIVDILLKAGANVDSAGMYSWTPLLVAVAGGHQECVALLLERKPNVNALDKDGLTALSIACREGLQEISSALIAAGAYVNIQDRVGDTPLIHAVKGGHRGVVEALLKRHADVDIQGKDRKTALYTSVEKGHTHIVKLMLASNPDLESSTKDGDTPLLRAVRNRHLEIVQMLLERRAKVNAIDRRGDTCLHVAMRARSKAIVEALLRNPKNSQLLYRANKAGETPYGLDTLHQKTILGQVFGARRLNTNEDSEGMLGYELYSSALADVLSEPTLNTPIVVGLYAKWGSGKSFLLAKLRDEMKNFARQWAEPPIKAPWLLLSVCIHLALLIGTAVGLGTWSYVWGVVTAALVLVFVYTAYLVLKYISKRFDFYGVYPLHHGIMKRIGRLRLIMQVAFCHPPGPQNDTQAMPVRFHFAETAASAPTGEGAVASMLVSLFEAIEMHYGSLPTRLYRAFRPKPVKASSDWRWRRMCCIPLILLFELGIIGVISGSALLIIFFSEPDQRLNSEAIKLSLYFLGAILLAGTVANLHSWAKALNSLLFSQGRHLKRAIKLNEGAPLTALGGEVALLTDMVKCLDAFTGQQSRLVGVVDALDSCDTERTLNLLNAIQTLLSTPNRPFVLLLAVDPHVIAKAAEANSRRLFTEGGIGGHDFLRNLVHLPVYLQNSGLRKVQRAQSTALAFRRNIVDMQTEEGTLGHSMSARRLSNASEIMSSQEKLRNISTTSRPGSRKLRLSESVASSIASNLHRVGQNNQGPIDLSKILLTDDYFSDVNPRSMRRLMNVIYITVRLLKAFQIDFSWYRLSSWINLTEQWPLRASMIVLQHDQTGDSIDDSVSLQTVYDKVRPKLACLRESAPLLELDRDERKLDAFLQLHKSDLLVADLRIFLPFTINLDPYLRKVLKEDQQAMEDEGIVMPSKINFPPPRMQPAHALHPHAYNTSFHHMYNNNNSNASNNSSSNMMPYYVNNHNNSDFAPKKKSSMSDVQHNNQFSHHEIDLPIDILNSFSQDVKQIRLSKLSVDNVIGVLSQVDEFKPALEKLVPILHTHSISGRVLLHCDLNELKSVISLSFGHWELFRLLITALRDIEKHQPVISFSQDTIDSNEGHNSGHPSQIVRQKSQMEKQVTLEEQMICGALQTLNEEAFEDVLGSERPSPTGGSADIDYVLLPTPQSIASTSASTSNSPILIRRDSILKHSGSIRTDKRVSIKPETPASVDYVVEKRNQKSTGPRPASLVLMRGERPIFKIGRSMSVDEDDPDKFLEGPSHSKAGNFLDNESIPLVSSPKSPNLV